MVWVLLVAAVVCEVAATSALKAAGGGSVPAIIGVVSGYLVSFTLVSRVVQQVEVGVVYAIWSAAGTALIAVAGVVLFGESLNLLKVMGLVLVITGVVALRLGSSAGASV